MAKPTTPNGQAAPPKPCGKMSKIAIKNLTDADIPTLLSLVQALSLFHDDEALATVETLRQMLLGEDAASWCLLAWDGENCIGYAAVFTTPNIHYGTITARLHHLYISEQWRGRGVGRLLVDAVSDRAQNLGATAVVIGTDPDNKQAQAAYKAMGLEDISMSGPYFRRLL